MQLQFALSALLCASMFAIPAMAVETDEDKKQRAVAKSESRAATNSTYDKKQNSVAVNQERDTEDFPKGHYKDIVNTSF
jgi:hypothetical protein